MKIPFAFQQAAIVSALSVSVGAFMPVGLARASALGPGKAAAAPGEGIEVDASAVPDFDRALVEQLSVDAAKSAEEYGFQPSEIRITIVWIDPASATYGIHVFIETSETKLPDGPRGPLASTCERCSQKRVPSVALEGLLNSFEVYERTRKEEQLASEAREKERQQIERERTRRAMRTTESDASAQHDDRNRKLRTNAAILLTLGGVVHVLGITFMGIWKVKNPDDGAARLYLEFYVPGLVLLAVSPAPIAAGTALLSESRREQRKPRVAPGLMGLRRGLGVSTTIRF